jgi:hypothetical protein
MTWNRFDTSHTPGLHEAAIGLEKVARSYAEIFSWSARKCGFQSGCNVNLHPLVSTVPASLPIFLEFVGTESKMRPPCHANQV